MAANNADSTGGEKVGIGSKIKAAAQVVHGIGENIRGTAMGAADTIAGSKSGEAKNENIVVQGQSEIAQGRARLKGHPTEQIRAGVGTGGQRRAGDQPPPLPPKDREPQTRQAHPQGPTVDPTRRASSEALRVHRGEGAIQDADEQSRNAPQKGPIHEKTVGGAGITGTGAGIIPRTQQSVRFSTPQQRQTGSESAQGRERSVTETGAEPASAPQVQSAQEKRTEPGEQFRKGQTCFGAGHEQESPGKGTQAASELRESEGAHSDNQGLIGRGADAPQGHESGI
ncbi:hypothetical protein PAXRUDRAFT_825185 [Paxillus rubicundulus Ve08.2h10]|uniref:Uncharacterized protein n=1 Tax=Paxillus rubicundulus Ve08.2h10 TaxID=930991 RepID=A0A0D0EB78_9AGAM|nr:hypothetical protein PAXRUDRAFT_825185 [Paxillus rubicundulus Ve08.2h10]